MAIRLIVTGANSDSLGAGIRVPDQIFGTFDAARDTALVLKAVYEGEGYVLAPNHLLLKGSEWRRVCIVDGHGMQWFLSDSDMGGQR